MTTIGARGSTFQDFLTSINAAPEVLFTELMKTSTRIAYILEACVKDRAPQAQGNLVNSFQARVQAMGRGAEAAVTSPVPYARIVDTGRRPGKMPPSGPDSELYRWVQLKVRRGEWTVSDDDVERTASDDDVERLVFLMARKIGRTGTKGTDYIKKAANKARPLIKKEMDQLYYRLKQEWP